MIDIEEINRQRREFQKTMKGSANLIDQIKNIARNAGEREGQLLNRVASEFQAGLKDAEKGKLKDFTKLINSIEKEINGNQSSSS